MKEFVIFVFSVDSKQNKVHVEFHHEGFWYSYDQCKFEVGTKQGLICHVKTVHEGVQYSYDQCDFKATRKQSLKVHVEAIYKQV